MMELHFPGSMASDVFFVGERFGRETVDAFVYYTSPMSFYSVNDSAIGRDLFRLCDLPESLSLGTWKQFGPETARYTALGMLLPLFQYRPVFQHALFGDAMPRVEAAPAAPIAHREASTLRPGPSADYQKAAFVRFLEHCAAKNQQVILIGGQFNPLQEAQMDPEVRPAYEGFLKECASRYPNVVLVWQKELLVQPPEAYVDETHVSEETQKRFTKAFADWYRQSGQAQRDLFTPRAAAAR